MNVVKGVAKIQQSTARISDGNGLSNYVQECVLCQDGPKWAKERWEHKKHKNKQNFRVPTQW